MIWMVVGVHGQLRSRSGRWLPYPVLRLLALAAIGGGWTTLGEAADARAYPMPGQLIDVGGHSRHPNCTGSGSPTVVLQPGAGEMSSNMGWIAPAVARGTRVCVYDCAGRGWSDVAVPDVFVFSLLVAVLGLPLATLAGLARRVHESSELVPQ